MGARERQHCIAILPANSKKAGGNSYKLQSPVGGFLTSKGLPDFAVQTHPQAKVTLGKAPISLK